LKNLCDYSNEQAKKILLETQKIICVISAAEPVQNLALNINEFITQKIADKVCEKTKYYQTTPILQGIITPFKPLASTGLHKNRFSSLISDCVCSLSFAGAKKIFFLTSSDLFSSSIIKGIKNYKSKLPSDFSVKIICWQNLKIVEKTVENQFENLCEYWRKESAIFLLANELKGIEIPNAPPKLRFSKEDFLKWKKRGMDPEKLRKLSPNYQFSFWTKYEPLNYSFLDKICDEICDELSKL